MESEFSDIRSAGEPDGLENEKGRSPFALLGVLLLVSSALYLWGNELQIVDPGFGFGWFAAVAALITSSLLFWFMLRRDGQPDFTILQFRGSRGSPFEISVLLFLLLPLAATFAGYAGAIRVLNCMLDGGSKHERTVSVLGSEYRRSKTDIGKRSWLLVQDGESKKWIPVGATQLDGLKRVPAIRLATGPGAWGGEWVLRVDALSE